jgi:hypothetical protein
MRSCTQPQPFTEVQQVPHTPHHSGCQHVCLLTCAVLLHHMQDKQALCAQGPSRSRQHLRAQGADALQPARIPQQADRSGECNTTSAGGMGLHTQLCLWGLQAEHLSAGLTAQHNSTAIQITQPCTDMLPGASALPVRASPAAQRDWQTLWRPPHHDSRALQGAEPGQADRRGPRVTQTLEDNQRGECAALLVQQGAHTMWAQQHVCQVATPTFLSRVSATAIRAATNRGPAAALRAAP